MVCFFPQCAAALYPHILRDSQKFLSWEEIWEVERLGLANVISCSVASVTTHRPTCQLLRLRWNINWKWCSPNLASQSSSMICRMDPASTFWSSFNLGWASVTPSFPFCAPLKNQVQTLFKSKALLRMRDCSVSRQQSSTASEHHLIRSRETLTFWNLSLWWIYANQGHFWLRWRAARGRMID